MIKYFPNRFKVLYRYILQRLEMKKRLPSVFGFEMTTKCNAQCIMCCRQEMKTIVKKDMNIKILEKIVNEVKKWPIERPLFNLTGLSEPLLCDNIVESVRYVKDNIPHSIAKIITNGIALERELAQDLMDAGLDRMTISLNAGSRRTYNKIAGVDQFDRVIGNIQSLVFIRRIRATP